MNKQVLVALVLSTTVIAIYWAINAGDQTNANEALTSAEVSDVSITDTLNVPTVEIKKINSL
jgi:hypothetical protein